MDSAATPSASIEDTGQLHDERENRDLASATHQTSSIIVELSLETPVHIRWISSSWLDIIGTNPQDLVEKPISELLADEDKGCFERATEALLADDSQSMRCCFWLVLPSAERMESSTSHDTIDDQKVALGMDGSGILIHDRVNGTPTHTMWVMTVVKDMTDFPENDLSPQLSEALLGGAEFLSTFLDNLTVSPETATPEALTCNICDRQIQPWFFEKHTALCIVSHKAESELQDCHDHLKEHKQILMDILIQLEQSSELISYRGNQIDTSSSVSDTNESGELSSRPIQHRKLHRWGRTLIKTTELILDYCDIAIDISTPAIPEEDAGDVFDRIQSPESCSRITQVLDWQPPTIGDPTLQKLYQDTHQLVLAKLSAVTRLHNTIHYSERIRQEINVMVQDLIDAATENAGFEGIGSGNHSEADEEVDLDLGSMALDLSDTVALPISAKIPKIVDTKTHTIESSLTSCHHFMGPHLDLFSSPSASNEKFTRHVEDKNINELETPDQEARSASPLSQFQPVFDNDTGPRSRSSLATIQRNSVSSTCSVDYEVQVPSQPQSRKNSPHDLDAQLREIRVSRGIYESPRHPSGGSRAPTGYSPSRRNSRAVSHSRASSLARERGFSPGGKVLSARLNLMEQDRFSPGASPTLSASDSTSTDTSFRDRKASAAPPLSPRLPSIAPAARPAPPSIKDFEIIKPISKGAFGSVYLSKKRTTGDYFAIKVLKKADMIAKNQVTNIKAERAIMMAQTESPFIAKLYFTFQSKEYLYLVMEYLNGGDCAALIKQLGGLSEDWTRRYLAEVVLGLEFLHSRGIIHRDLKPDNLLISHTGHLKLTDFGLSRVGLVGRQNRAHSSSHPEVPDLLHNHSFGPHQTKSSVSSRSTSFDLAPSSLSTPAIAPMSLGTARQDYFDLRERKVSQESPSELHKTDSETIAMSFTKLNLHGKHISDDSSSGAIKSNASPTTSPITPHMPPPAMKLFDPKDGNRKFVGTPDYLAPETINGSGQDDMVDWWSLGVILFEFLYGYPPFHARTPDKVFQNILERSIDWPSETEQTSLGISEEAHDLMERLMAMQPSERLGSANGAADVKSHDFFAGVSWDKISEEEALFIPTPDHPEDTEYFDTRGATNHIFEDDSEAIAAGNTTTTSDKDAKVSTNFASKIAAHNKQVSKRSMMPLSIPPHVRERRHHHRRLSESGKDEFGSFTFKNLGVLEKQNLDAIKRLRSQANLTSPVPIPRESHQRSASSSGSSYVKRSTSSFSSISSSTPISPTNPSGPSRQAIPSSPLISSQSALQRSKGTNATSLSFATIDSPHLQFDQGLPQKSRSLPVPFSAAVSPRNRAFTVGSEPRPELSFSWSPQKQSSRVFDPETPSSSSDNETSTGVQALRRVQRRRQRSKRLSSISIIQGSEVSRQYRPLDIMICEDNPVSRRVLEAMLSKLRCRVVSVVDGAQAVAAATGDVVFDLIFTDIKIPRLSGVEVARLIKSSSGTNCTTPIAAMSSYSTADILDMAHFEKKLEKPLTLSAVSETIQELVQDWLAPSIAQQETRL